MDDLVNWIKNNLKIVLISMAGLIIFSVIVGLTIGLISKSKKRYNQELNQQLSKLEKAEERERQLVSKGQEDSFLVPPPVQIDMDVIFISKYPDDLSYILNNLKLRPIKLSDLINERTMGENTTVKAVIFDNEEKGILTIKDDIIEPKK